MRRASLLAIGVAVTMLLGNAGCALVKPGAGCKGNAAVCADKSNALACEGGTYKSYPCTGPLGCAEVAGGAVMCDQSAGAAAAAPCAPVYSGFAQCAADSSAVLVCRDGLWQPAVCPAGTSCQRDATSVWCGVSQ